MYNQMGRILTWVGFCFKKTLGFFSVSYFLRFDEIEYDVVKTVETEKMGSVFDVFRCFVCVIDNGALQKRG